MNINVHHSQIFIHKLYNKCTNEFFNVPGPYILSPLKVFILENLKKFGVLFHHIVFSFPGGFCKLLISPQYLHMRYDFVPKNLFLPCKNFNWLLFIREIFTHLNRFMLNHMRRVWNVLFSIDTWKTLCMDANSGGKANR